MMSNWQASTAFSFIGSIFAYLFGVDYPELFLIALICMAADTALGTVYAMKVGNCNAEGMKKAIYKVILYGSFIIMFRMARLTLDSTATFDAHLLDLFALLFLIAREGKSITEHMDRFGLPLPFNPFQKIEELINSGGRDFMNKK